MCEDRVLLSELIFTFLYAGSSTQNASERASHSSGVSIFVVQISSLIHPHKKQSN
jgi:hypothetical protein